MGKSNIIYDSPYQKLIYHIDNEFYEEIWKPESENLTESAFYQNKQITRLIIYAYCLNILLYFINMNPSANSLTNNREEYSQDKDILLESFDNFLIYKVGEQNLKKFSEFVFNIYARDYKEKYNWDSSEEDLLTMIQEDLSYSNHSSFIAIKTHSNRFVGTVRLSHKIHDEVFFPIEKEFRINVKELLKNRDVIYNEIWHCGRLAIDKTVLREESININTIKLLKKLIFYIGNISFKHQDNILVSESDYTSYKLMRALGINIQIVGEDKNYLGSITYPTMTYSKDYHAWYNTQTSI